MTPMRLDQPPAKAHLGQLAAREGHAIRDEKQIARPHPHQQAQHLGRDMQPEMLTGRQMGPRNLRRLEAWPSRAASGDMAGG